MMDQHSALRVKLSDLIEGMDFQSDEQSSFRNLTTEAVVSTTDEELRAAVVWLCSAAASFVTGHTMAVDGGLVAQ